MHHFSVHSSCSNTLFYPIIFFILFNAASTTNQISNYIDHIEISNSRKLLSYNGDVLAINPSFSIENFRLKNAYIALQAWKEVILSDPHNITQNWVGSNVCSYTGVFCSPSLDQPSELTVSGIDINHGDIAESFLNLKLLFELDISNNRFVGKFPDVVVQMPNLKFLDLRFNEFEGALPKQLFERDLDALFINNNRFSFELPDNFGNSPVSVMVLANNNFVGCVPDSIGEMVSLEQLNLGHNMFSGMVSSNICTLPNLENFVYEHNYFSEESPACLNLNSFADQQNCLRDRPMQRPSSSPLPTTPPENNCCICLPPPSPSPLPSIELPSSPLPLPAPSGSPSPPSISPSPSPSSPQPPDLPSPSPSPSFVEPQLPSPLPCENQRTPSSQDMSSPSP